MKLSALMIFIWNLIIIFIYGIDKYRARKNLWRISEKMLIIPAFLFGSIGAMFGMILFNHKTSKIKFRLLIPLSFVINALLIILIGYAAGQV